LHDEGETFMSGPTKEHVALAYAVIRAGGTQATLAGAVGVHERTIRKWLDEACAAEHAPAFRAEYARARSDLHQDLVGAIIAAIPDDWKAAAWILERRYGEWAQSVKLQVKEQIHDGIAQLRDELGEEMSERVLRVIAEAGSGAPPRAH
jgi:predicted transcriptional regulator